MVILSWTSNDWYWKLQIISLGLVAATVIIGGLTIFAGIRANKRQAERILILERANIEAQKALESERLKRLALEKLVNPRELPQRPLDADHSSVFDALHPFAGTKVILEFLPEKESSRAAASIFFALHDAKWEIPEYAGNEGLEMSTSDGVVVFFTSESEAAGTALIAILKSHDWHARLEDESRDIGGLYPKKLPPGWLKITVGFKTPEKDPW